MKEYFLLNSAYKHKAGNIPETDFFKELKVLKNEEFGLQFLIRKDHEFYTTINDYKDISWKGLIDEYRVVIEAREEKGNNCNSYFELRIAEYAVEDHGNNIADILSDKRSKLSETKDQLLYISGKVPKDFKGEKIILGIKVYYSKEYLPEEVVYEEEVEISIADISIPDMKDSLFYLDLWQHPCNWARAYDVPYFSEVHFEIIDHYLEGMGKLGQKVCDLIISDFSWAGQRCYQVEENHNNLFELNIVKVWKNIEGKINCDFTAFDRFISLCEKHGISQEINLFGILGNWDRVDFGNPLEDYEDPIRISYYDEKSESYKYFTLRDEVKEYLAIVFHHLEDLKLWDKTLIMSDEPNNTKLFQEAIKLFKEAAGGLKIVLKCAIHNQEFFENNDEYIHSISLSTCELVHNLKDLERLRAEVIEKNGKLTWYSCCFPKNLNIFLESPLIESRIKGWFTYFMNVDGFLRWSFGIWPGDVFNDASYKKEKWTAGDMFFVYPGKNGYPLESIRMKNFLYGLQDFYLLKEAENSINADRIRSGLKEILGKKEEMNYINALEVELHYSLEYEKYMNFRNSLIEKIAEK